MKGFLCNISLHFYMDSGAEIRGLLVMNQPRCSTFAKYASGIFLIIQFHAVSSSFQQESLICFLESLTFTLKFFLKSRQLIEDVGKCQLPSKYSLFFDLKVILFCLILVIFLYLSMSFLNDINLRFSHIMCTILPLHENLEVSKSQKLGWQDASAVKSVYHSCG